MRRGAKNLELHAHGYTAVILPERGGSCVDLAKGDVHALRTPKSMTDYEGNPFLYGTPLLFFPNRISGGSFDFEGRRYVLPMNEPATGCFLHGTLHETPFAVEQKWVDYVRLVYRAQKENLYLTFPHVFTLTLEWTLGEDGLHQRVIFLNESPENMPVALAFHTTFRIPFVPDSSPENVQLMLDVSCEYGRDMRTCLPNGYCWEDFSGKREMAAGSYIPAHHTISRLFRMGGRRKMRLIDRTKGAEISYRAGETYGYWMVYNGGSKEFLCVEPQSWLSNCPNAPFDRTAHGFVSIVPGEAYSYETVMSIRKI